jgi:hypothetical protein
MRRQKAAALDFLGKCGRLGGLQQEWVWQTDCPTRPMLCQHEMENLFPRKRSLEGLAFACFKKLLRR